MKKLLLAIALLAAVVTTYGQGRVNFSNGSTTAISTNDGVNSGLISGAGNFYFGLYVGPQGTAPSALTLTLLATNTSIAGRLTGGNPAPMPAPYADGSTLTFQIRGWSSEGGILSYEARRDSGTGWYGQSTVGTVTPTFSPTGAAALFGTAANNVAGFALTPVPEPSSIALGLLGLGAIALFRRRK
jgi:hypothetical protein